MLNLQLIKSLTDLRLNPTSIAFLAQKTKEPVYIFNRNKPISVLLDVKSYEELIENLEDALDALEMREFEKRPKNKKDWTSHKKLLKKLNIK